MLNAEVPAYKFKLLFESAEMFEFVKECTSFTGASVYASLSWQVSGIVGQRNSLSDPFLLGGHGDAIYDGIGCQLG